MPWLLIILCFPTASAAPPLGGIDVVATTQTEKDKNSWDECKELLKKAKKKKVKKKDSTEKENK